MSIPLPDKIKLEVCVDSVESAIASMDGGADRLEVCASLKLGGGTTPSIGLVLRITKECAKRKGQPIEIVALIRCRTGGFLYTDEEVAVMLEDISALASTGIVAVAIGALTCKGTIDELKMGRLINAAHAWGLEVCLHRASDMTKDKLDHDLLSRIGIQRVLTSGGEQTAIKGIERIASLLIEIVNLHKRTSGWIEVMPGSGITPENAKVHVQRLARYGLTSIHLSGGRYIQEYPDCPADGMVFRKEGMGMGVSCSGDKSEEWSVWRTSASQIYAVRQAIDEELQELKKQHDDD